MAKTFPPPLPPAPVGKESPAERKKRRESMEMYGGDGLQGDLDRIAQLLLERALREGLELTGPEGVLGRLTKSLLETAGRAELEHHLGAGWHADEVDGSGNRRNGTRTRTVITEAGAIEVQMPRDRAGTFEPTILPRGARRLDGFDRQVLDLYAKGLTMGEIQAHLADFYHTEVSTELISAVTDAVLEELKDWHNRPLDPLYPVLFVDCIHVKIRDGAVASRPIYLVIGITMDGQREVLGIWAGSGGEAASYWATVLAEVKNRGVADALIVCCDGLTGLDQAIEGTWPQAKVQRCVVHVTRAALRYVPANQMAKVAAGLRTVYDAATLEAAEMRLEEFAAEFTALYPAAVTSVREAWAGMIPFFDLPREVRKMIYTTNMIESFNARVRSAATRHGHFPNETAARKVVYLVVKGHGGWPKRSDPAKRVNNWKMALNQLVLHFGERLGL
jgi:putative transposase